MPTPQILKQIILICLLIHRSTRLLVCVVSMEWMARSSGMRMGYFPSPSFNRLYLWLGGVLSSWRSINGGRTNSMLGIHYLRTLPPPWFLCFAWKPKVRTLKLSSSFFQWWVAVLSRPVWCLSMGVKEFSNLCSSNSIALNLEFWNSLELLNGVKYYPLPEIYEFNSSIIDLPFNDYINGKLSLIFLKSLSNSSCLSIFSSVYCSFNCNLTNCWVLLVGFMAPKEKTKPKKMFKNTLLNRSDLVSSIEVNTDDSVIKPKLSSLVEEAQQSGNGDFHPTKADCPKKLEKGESSKTQKRMDAASFFNKLSKRSSVSKDALVCFSMEFNKYKPNSLYLFFKVNKPYALILISACSFSNLQSNVKASWSWYTRFDYLLTTSNGLWWCLLRFLLALEVLPLTIDQLPNKISFIIGTVTCRFKRPTHHNIWILRRFAYVNCRNHLIGSNENNTGSQLKHTLI